MRNWGWLLVGLGLLLYAGLDPGAAFAAKAGASEPGDDPIDPKADKTAVTVDLQAGFVLDPFLLPVVGNGDRAANSVESGCSGYIDVKPDVTVNWSGVSNQLSFFVYGDDDAVLLVEQPDGSVLCNDDAGLDTVQPLVEIPAPAAGEYRVYVGSAEQGKPALGALGITQAKIDAATLAELDLTPLLRRHVYRAPAVQLDPNRLPDLPAITGHGTKLTPDFGTVRVLVAGGGDIAALLRDGDQLTCAGFVNPIASYHITWTGKSEDLRLFLESRSDSSLFVVTPDKKVLCGAGTADNPHPIVDIMGTTPGDYRVYVANTEPNKLVAGRLTITEDMQAEPTAVAGQGQ
jgi:hypothetical protein